MVAMKQKSKDQQPIGLIAGWGRFPVQVAQKIKDQGKSVVAVAITGHASHELESICDDILWSGKWRIQTEP